MMLLILNANMPDSSENNLNRLCHCIYDLMKIDPGRCIIIVTWNFLFEKNYSCFISVTKYAMFFFQT